MEPVLIYGFPMGSSMGLIAALEWLGAPYKQCRVETPVCVTSLGELLTETSAIAAWLEARDAQRRISFDPLTRETELMHQQLAFINTAFNSAFSPLWAALEMETPDPAMPTALRDWGRRSVIERHDRVEDDLRRRTSMSTHQFFTSTSAHGYTRLFECRINQARACMFLSTG